MATVAHMVKKVTETLEATPWVMAVIEGASLATTVLELVLAHNGGTGHLVIPSGEQLSMSIIDDNIQVNINFV